MPCQLPATTNTPKTGRGYVDSPASGAPNSHCPQNGPDGLNETVYYIDYQGARIISLNSNEERGDQVPWLEAVLRENPNRWTLVTFHHPLYATGEGRDNKTLRKLWKPLFDRYRVDLVLQGHDHSYGRGSNLPTGAIARDEGDGTVYVVSVSGPKQYKLTSKRWWRRGAENTQLYQTIDVDGDTLRYEARTATSELYDAFDLIKQEDAPNILVDRVPDTPPRTHRKHDRGPGIAGNRRNHVTGRAGCAS